jgi:hypothetical protein
MKPYIITALIGLSLFAFAACGPEDEEEPVKKDREDVTLTTISTDFTTNAFTSGDETALLKELKICDAASQDDTDPSHPSCSPKYFRFFKLGKSVTLKNGFILLVKAGVSDSPLRRILIFERENGELIKVNGFYGNLIEQRPTTSGYDDIVVRFTDNIEGSLAYYNCLFQWNGGQYEYKLCEAIQEGGQEAPHRIKAEYIDSMAPEIKTILDRNNMIF